jgi:hypothetical protein
LFVSLSEAIGARSRTPSSFCALATTSILGQPSTFSRRCRPFDILRTQIQTQILRLGSIQWTPPPEAIPIPRPDPSLSIRRYRPAEIHTKLNSIPSKSAVCTNQYHQNPTLLPAAKSFALAHLQNKAWKYRSRLEIQSKACLHGPHENIWKILETRLYPVSNFAVWRCTHTFQVGGFFVVSYVVKRTGLAGLLAETLSQSECNMIKACPKQTKLCNKSTLFQNLNSGN